MIRPASSHAILLTRGIFGLAAAAIVTAVAAQGCAQTGVGDPCRPEREYDPTFTGFDRGEVNVESQSFQCQTRVCLVNHFQGRVSCPYGQAGPGRPFEGGDKACFVPGTGGQTPVTGDPDPKIAGRIPGQCFDRQAETAVYCSCRCANADGKTDDGANYCECPDGFACEQLVGSIGPKSDEQLAGGYCIKNGTKYTASNTCATTCTPGSANLACPEG